MLNTSVSMYQELVEGNGFEILFSLPVLEVWRLWIAIHCDFVWLCCDSYYDNLRTNSFGWAGQDSVKPKNST